MSHRNGKPKPHASERTQRRWRDRHDISTTEDNAYFKTLETVKDEVRMALEKFKIIPKKETLVGQVATRGNPRENLKQKEKEILEKID